MIYIDDSEPEGVLAPAFSYRDVTINRGVDAHEIYDIISEVGRGKFGTVYKCQEKSTGLKLAAKFVPIPKRDDKRNVEREVEIMNSLQHHLIIQLYAAYEYQKMMCVVLELVEGGELFDRVIDDDFILTERVCVVFIRQVCEAIEFIHRNNILHLDLKPENILCLTQSGNRIKIIDFGLARKYDPNKRLQILFGTPEFVAPEVVNFDCIAYGTDMWSVGVICYVLISGLSPFMGETDIETMANVTIAKYDFEDESFGSVSSECLDFISKLLVKDLSTRMTAAQCLQHKWLQRRPPTVGANKLVTAQRTIELPPHSDANNVPDNNEGKGLDSTKDNLKNFIERWEEHPNSPYVFDVEANVIAPINETMYKKSHGVDSISSSRVCSPSPCESIGTVTDDDVAIYDDDSVEMKTPINLSREQLFASSADGGASGSGSGTPTPLHHMPLQLGLHRAPLPADRSLMSYLHTFDRRNSDTNYLLGRRSSGERVNLADEIRKLSDHLLMLAEINTKLGGDATMTEDANNNINEKVTATATATTSSSTATTTSSLTTTSSSSGIMKKTKTVQKTKNKSVTMLNATTLDNASNTLSLRLENAIEESPPILANGGDILQDIPMMETATTGMGATTKMKAKTRTKANAIETASVRRAKFRINQMSRDVPIGLPDTHQTVNLEEAANTTKDCLLHLLEKYNDTKSRNPLGRHQSISVDWNVSDNLEYRSMNSINAFFQRHVNTQNKVKQLQAQLENKTSGK